MKTQRTKLLTDSDLDPVAVMRGNSPLLFTAPHNSTETPQKIESCLGMNPEWWEKAHEAHDLYMQELFTELQKAAPHASYLQGNYSRLVCDLNIKPDYAITPNSSEYQETKIPANQPNKCCKNQNNLRLQEIYWPYHDTKHDLIKDIRKEHKGAIVLDLHSFTPVYKGDIRDVEISTIRCEKTPFSKTLESFFRKDQDDYKYVSGQPYKVAQRPNNAARLISSMNNLQYLGLEIRNDLIDTPEKRSQMAQFILRATNHVLTMAQKNEEIIDLRSNVLTEDEKKAAFDTLDKHAPDTNIDYAMI